MDQRLKDLRNRMWEQDSDVMGLLEEAFELGLVEGQEIKSFTAENQYLAQGINPVAMRANYKNVIGIINRDDKCRVMNDMWSYDDIRLRCIAEGIPSDWVNDKLIADICYSVLKNYDPENGINWEVIDFWITVRKIDLYKEKNHGI